MESFKSAHCGCQHQVRISWLSWWPEDSQGRHFFWQVKQICPVKGKDCIQEAKQQTCSDLLKTGGHSAGGIRNWKFQIYNDKVYHAGSDSSRKTAAATLCPQVQLITRLKNYSQQAQGTYRDVWQCRSSTDTQGIPKAQAAPTALSCCPLWLAGCPVGVQEYTQEVDPAGSEAAHCPQLRAPGHMSSQGHSPTPAAGTTDP